ncbi:MAG: hypothetical protein NW226_00675 [Microscillaceae bacterium]|nr:hypothetical protein [Microscillaceae bacterium]
MKRLKSLFLLNFCMCVIWFLTGCGGNSGEEQAQEGLSTIPDTTTNQPKVKEEEPKPIDRKFDDLARLIAGLAPQEGSTYQELCQTDAWKQYAQTADVQWKNINEKKLPLMTEWRDQELKAPNEEKGLIFYPFSGPDFLHVHTFFPKADEIVMIGLEPIGNLPDIDAISKNSLGAYMNGLQQGLYHILTHSFFRTLSMAQDFTGRRVAAIDGTLPILMLFLARTDHKVLYYEKVAVNLDGKLVPAEELKSDSTYYGTKIAFQKNSEPNSRKYLYYFAANLQNDPYVAESGLKSGGLIQRTDFKKYIESLDIKTTYLKSASYLMYRETFSIIRNLILDKSKYLLQDDSGMPINFIDRNKWDLTFYGSYYAPIALFSVRYQPELRKIYAQKENVKPLPFGIGYQFQAGTSNLMLGVKK